MLSTNDIQLFCNLLDSLGNSLRELAIKYELLVSSQSNATADRQKTDAAVLAVSGEILSMAKDIDSLTALVGDGREGHAKTAATIQSLVKLVDSLNSKMDEAKSDTNSLKSEALNAKTSATEVRGVLLHVDSHMDQFCGQLALITTIPAEIAKMAAAVDAMKQQLEPFKKLAALFSKPAAIIVGIYIVVVTIISAMEGCTQYNKIRTELFPTTTNLTVRVP
jgi:hypothetical protein